MAGYVVVDVETTGLFPHKDDRVLEIGVVLVGDDGEVQTEWATLLNPERDVGPTEIHGLSAEDVAAAPTFADIAPRLLADCEGRTLVAHNAPFDLMFLRGELRRCGLLRAHPKPTGICTMYWSSRVIAGAPRRLADCCSAVGVPLDQAHSALSDARAAAHLLAMFLVATYPTPVWFEELAATRSFPWPSVPRPWPAVRLHDRPAPVPRRPAAWMDSVVAGMPRHEHAEVDAYLEILESALLDRYLSSYEEQSLCQMAELLGFHVSSLLGVHRDYLATLATVAWADGVVTVEERADMDLIAELLGLSETDVDAAIAGARSPGRD